MYQAIGKTLQDAHISSLPEGNIYNPGGAGAVGCHCKRLIIIKMTVISHYLVVLCLTIATVAL